MKDPVLQLLASSGMKADRTVGESVSPLLVLEETNDFVSQQTNERWREHGLRDVGVFEVVVRLSDDLEQR